MEVLGRRCWTVLLVDLKINGWHADQRQDIERQPQLWRVRSGPDGRSEREETSRPDFVRAVGRVARMTGRKDADCERERSPAVTPFVGRAV